MQWAGRIRLLDHPSRQGDARAPPCGAADGAQRAAAAAAQDCTAGSGRHCAQDHAGGAAVWLWLGQLHWAPAGVQGCNCAGAMPRGASAEPCSKPHSGITRCPLHDEGVAHPPFPSVPRLQGRRYLFTARNLMISFEEAAQEAADQLSGGSWAAGGSSSAAAGGSSSAAAEGQRQLAAELQAALGAYREAEQEAHASLEVRWWCCSLRLKHCLAAWACSLPTEAMHERPHAHHVQTDSPPSHAGQPSELRPHLPLLPAHHRRLRGTGALG